VSQRLSGFRWEDAYFAGNDDSAQENPFVGPLFESDVEMGLGPVEIDKGGQYDGDFNFCPRKDIVDHDTEGRPFRVP
jgi:hypothetical protein